MNINPMTVEEYRVEAKRTRKENRGDLTLANWAISLAEEAGETAGVIKKMLFHGHDRTLARELIVKELGDLLWYADAIMEWYGISWDEVFVANAIKLRNRYPEGFSKEASITRTDCK